MVEAKRRKPPKGKPVTMSPYFWKRMEARGLSANEFRFEVEDIYALLEEKGLNMTQFIEGVRLLYGESQSEDQKLVLEMAQILKEDGVIGLNELRVSLAGVNGAELSNKFLNREKQIAYEKEQGNVPAPNLRVDRVRQRDQYEDQNRGE
jgi:hypothetical protein